MDYFKPLVSIIIPTFNRAHLIGETLASVNNQTYQNWECIVVDDESSDETENLVRKLAVKEGRIKFYKRERLPKGAPTCRNIGMEKANGKYIIFLDSDDLLADFCLERRVEFFAKNPLCDFLVFQTAMFKLKISDADVYWNIANNEDDLLRFLRTEALWYTGAPIYKKDIISQNNGFKEGLPFWQDTELGMRILLKKSSYIKFLHLEPDIFVRQLPGSISRTKTISEDPVLLGERIKILIDILKVIKFNKHKLTKEQANTLSNVLYTLSSRFLIEHNDYYNFRHYWFISCRYLKINYFRYAINYFYQILKYWQKFSIYFIKPTTVYTSVFKKYLQNDKEFEKVLLFKAKYQN